MRLRRRNHRRPQAPPNRGVLHPGPRDASIVGVIIARFIPSTAPAASRPVPCPRCNAVSNVPDDQTEFECWQCKQRSPVPQSPPSPLALDEPRYKYAKIATAALLVATAAVFLTIQFRESSRRMDDAQDTFLTICFREENGGYTLGETSRAAIATCEKKYDSFDGGPRWRTLKTNLDDYEKCITEARAQMASGNFAKFEECTAISNR